MVYFKINYKVENLITQVDVQDWIKLILKIDESRKLSLEWKSREASTPQM